VLLDGRAAARVEVVHEPVEEVLRRGIERVGLGGRGLVGERLGAADLRRPGSRSVSRVSNMRSERRKSSAPGSDLTSRRGWRLSCWR